MVAMVNTKATAALIPIAVSTFLDTPRNGQIPRNCDNTMLFTKIAGLVQMVEIILKKVSPALYQALGVFLPLITTNCCILGVAILVIQKDYDLLTGVVYAFSTAIGFGLALVLFAGLREQMSLVKIPKGMQGTPIALITAGLLAMAFMGFSGVV